MRLPTTWGSWSLDASQHPPRLVSTEGSSPYEVGTHTSFQELFLFTLDLRANDEDPDGFLGAWESIVSHSMPGVRCGGWSGYDNDSPDLLSAVLRYALAASR